MPFFQSSFFKNFFSKKQLPSAEELLFGEDKKRLLFLFKKMGNQALEALKDTMEALQKRDVERAREILKGDDNIDQMEANLERESLYAIALRRPVQENLRFLISLIKAAGDLERTGDQVANVAERIIALGVKPLAKPLEDIPTMGSLALKMLEYAIESFEKEDAALALEVSAMDDQVDELYERVFTHVLALVSRRQPTAQEELGDCMSLVLIARHLERVADQAVNIARRSYFMRTGTSMNEKKQKPPSMEDEGCIAPEKRFYKRNLS